MNLRKHDLSLHSLLCCEEGASQIFFFDLCLIHGLAAKVTALFLVRPTCNLDSPLSFAIWYQQYQDVRSRTLKMKEQYEEQLASAEEVP